MRKIGLLFICVLIKFLFNAQAPNILWQKSYGGSEVNYTIFDLYGKKCLLKIFI